MQDTHHDSGQSECLLIFIYDINCELREKEVYVKTRTVPTLVLDNKEGSVLVVGGRKGVKEQDYAEENGIPVLTGDNE